MWQKLHAFFIKPFTVKGPFLGLLDLAVKAVALLVWGYLTIILASLMWASLRTDYNTLTQLWWFSYCFLLFFGASLLAYILLFVRTYNEEPEQQELI